MSILSRGSTSVKERGWNRGVQERRGKSAQRLNFGTYKEGASAKAAETYCARGGTVRKTPGAERSLKVGNREAKRTGSSRGR